MSRNFLKVGVVAACIVVAMLFHSVFADSPVYRGKTRAVDEIVAPYSWTGIYLGVGGGYGVTHTEASTDQAFIDGLSADGWVGDVKLGVNYQLANTPFVLGAFGCYNVGKTKFETDGLVGPFSATFEPTWCAGGTVGLAFATRTHVYVGAAWIQAEADFGTFGSQTRDGVRYLVGLEQALTPTLSLGAEYALDDVDFKVGLANVDVENHTFKARLNWRPLGGLFGN